jgi:protoporphyrinogen oxidase
MSETLILGAGMTGLAAGMVSKLPVLEAESSPGGICCSYYMRPDSKEVLATQPADEEVYRFENGGGHWLFGGDPIILEFISKLVPVERYARVSSVYFPDTGKYVDYPLQNHLRQLPAGTARVALEEMARTDQPPLGPHSTMEEWLSTSFGSTLCELFFTPFHALYTAGLYRTIAPQDAYKSPVDLKLALRGAFDDVPAVGYNTTFLYPKPGLNVLAQRMAAKCRLERGARVVAIDTAERTLELANGKTQPFDRLVSTLPLNVMLDMAGVHVDARPDPHSSVLVVNIGATRGARCPKDHWLYIPRSDSGFHRVGFYSNVDAHFIPASARREGNRVSIYVERAYPGGARPAPREIDDYCAAVVRELEAWGYIGRAEVVHPTWIDVAYTWSWPGSKWRDQGVAALAKHGIFQIGRYARWTFQGIADSIRDGFIAGGALAKWSNTA